MTRPIEHAELERFRGIIAARFGWEFSESKLDFASGVLQRRLDTLGSLTPAAYMDLLANCPPAEEMRALAAELTVTETYFLRGSEHFQALRGSVLPERIRVRGDDRRLRLLSAGCASGEEAYSLAITLREHFPQLDSWDVKIRGVDVNPRMVEKARRGKYSEWALRETPPEIRARYFRSDGAEFLLDERIRSMVSFEERNLAGDEFGSFAGEGGFDVILCRNVLMYLVSRAAQQVMERITRALAPGGYLFLGYAETLRGLSQDFQLQHTHESFYYRKLGAGDERRLADCGLETPAADLSWVDAVEKTCQSIDRLAQTVPHATEAAPPARPVELGLALDLLRQERFGEALELIHRLPPESAADPDTQLLQAVLLTNCGALEAAEGICRQLSGADDLNASAHYVMALCREHAGDARSSTEHDRAAIYLDPAFAMPHLHLGRLAKRGSDWMTARGELQRAAALLEREDAARILLFGGGFSREALVAFSRAELCSSGGAL